MVSNGTGPAVAGVVELAESEWVAAPMDDYEAYCLWKGIEPQRSRRVRLTAPGRVDVVIEDLGSTVIAGPWGVER